MTTQRLSVGQLTTYANSNMMTAVEEIEELLVFLRLSTNERLALYVLNFTPGFQEAAALF